MCPALAQDSRITQVTLYPGSATVQRNLQLASGGQQQVHVPSHDSPQPKTLQWSAQAGSALWEQTLAPQASERFRGEHSLSWPSKMRLRERR